ncbi:MAG: hypothetical protein ABSA44_12705 [Bacteroidota bacterium]
MPQLSAGPLASRKAFMYFKQFILMLAFSSLLYSADSLTTTDKIPTIRWIGFVNGNIDSAMILSKWPVKLINNYGVLFNTKRFDPFDMGRYDEPSTRIMRFKDVFLLIDIPAPDSLSTYSVEIRIDKGIPVCINCDGGCAHLDRRETKNIQLEIAVPLGKSIRKLFNIREYIKDWHLVDVKIIVAMCLGKNKLLEDKIKMDKWPWCL